MTFVEILIAVAVVIGILGLLDGNAGGAMLIVIALFITMVVITSNSADLSRKGFQSVGSANIVETFAVTRNAQAHIPGTPEGCRVRLTKRDNKWYVNKPQIASPVETAQALTNQPDIVRWCGQHVR